MVRPLGYTRDADVHALLQQRFGEVGLGLEHHLRCLISGIAQRALLPIRLPLPCHSALAANEQRLLLALAKARRYRRRTGSVAGQHCPLVAGGLAP